MDSGLKALDVPRLDGASEVLPQTVEGDSIGLDATQDRVSLEYLFHSFDETVQITECEKWNDKIDKVSIYDIPKEVFSKRLESGAPILYANQNIEILDSEAAHEVVQKWVQGN